MSDAYYPRLIPSLSRKKSWRRISDSHWLRLPSGDHSAKVPRTLRWVQQIWRRRDRVAIHDA